MFLFRLKKNHKKNNIFPERLAQESRIQRLRVKRDSDIKKAFVCFAASL